MEEFRRSHKEPLNDTCYVYIDTNNLNKRLLQTAAMFTPVWDYLHCALEVRLRDLFFDVFVFLARRKIAFQTLSECPTLDTCTRIMIELVSMQTMDLEFPINPGEDRIGDVCACKHSLCQSSP